MEQQPTQPKRKAKLARRSVIGAPSKEFSGSLPELQSNLRRSTHTAWVSGIVGKFRPKVSRFGNSRVTLIDLARAKPRKADVHLHAGPSHHTHQHINFNVIGLHFNALSGAIASSTPRSSQPLISSSVAGVRRAFVNGYTGLAKSRWSGALPVGRRLEYCREIDEETQTGDFTPPGLKQVNLRRWIGRALVLETAEETALPNIVAHLLRKHRRTDVGKGQLGRQFGRQVRRIFNSNPMQMKDSVRNQGRFAKVEGSTAVAPTATVIAPQPFSVSQITDEVMKQLDRKLVAARERMGRI